MENNKICNWFLYYSKQNFRGFNSDNVIDVEASLVIKKGFCSSFYYFDCGHVLFDDFPPDSTGFLGIFDYLVNDKGKVMETMKAEEIRSCILRLSDYDSFSMRHHVSIIKCLMKIYICRLAPWDRIKRALEAMEASIDPESIANLGTFRHAQRCLILWLRKAALKGLQRLFRLDKHVSQAQISTTIDNSTMGNLVIYAMVYYVPDKLIKHNVTLPHVDVTLNNDASMVALACDHSRIVTMAFSDICNRSDILPLQIDCLISRSMDTVPSTLTIALVFHWIFGNSLKNLGNRIKSSIASPKSERLDKTPHIRQSNDNALDHNEPRTFFMNGYDDCSENLRGLLSKRKEHRDITNGSLDSVVIVDSSPEVFLGFTDEYVTLPGTTLPPALMRARPDDNSSLLEPTAINLRVEFQKKLQQRQNFIKPKDLNISPSGETTWLAQKNRCEVNTIPLTPKKTAKVPEVTSQNESTQNLSKGQLNQIQMTLSLSRQKIVSDQRKFAVENEKSLEDSKRQIFFRAIGGQSNIIRPRSLESVNGASIKDREAADKRLSMYLKRTEQNLGFSPLRRTLSKEKLQSFKDRGAVPLSRCSLDGNQESVAKEGESRQSLPVSELEIRQETQQEIFVEDHKTPENADLPNLIKVSPEESLLDTESVLKKRSSPSIVSVSSDSNVSFYQHMASEKDYHTPAEHVTQSLVSLPEEDLSLTLQQLSWNMQPLNNQDLDSVAEATTNNGISLTDVSDLSKQVPVPSSSLTDGDPIKAVRAVSPVQLESVNEVSPTLLQDVFNSPEPFRVQMKIESAIEPCHCISPSSQISTLDSEAKLDQMDEPCQKGVLDHGRLVNESGDDNLSTASIMEQDRSGEVTLSSGSVEVSNVQPVSFIVSENQIESDALRKQGELRAIRDQKRVLKFEMDKQKREQDRESKCSASNKAVLERERKKKLEQEKKDVLLRKHVDSKNGEKVPGLLLSERRPVSMVDTSDKSLKKSQNQSPNVKGVRRESAENLSVAGHQRNSLFSSKRQSQPTTSSSTSELNTNLTVNDSAKNAVPHKTQEYAGPKLFGKKTVKTNRSVIQNAISHCCLAGSVNEHIKEVVLKELSESEATHFMILFRDSRCQYRSLYLFDMVTEELSLVTGNGPKRITHEMAEKFYKYNSGAKQFNLIQSTKHLSTAVDAICIQSVHWNTRPSGQVLSAAVSTASISQTKTKRAI